MFIDKQGIHYELNKEKFTAKILPSINIKGDILIPGKIKHESNEYIITEISEKSFQKNQIKSLVFEDDSFIISIPKNAFSCSSIQHLHLSNNIKELKEGWCHCTLNLTSITISPQNKSFQIFNDKLLIGKSIDTKDFEGNYDTLYFVNRNAKKVSIPSTIKQINSYSFEFCQNIEDVKFQNKSELIKICHHAFAHSVIKSIIIPRHVLEISYKSFYFCTNIKNIQFEENSEIKKIGDDAFTNSSAIDFLLEFKQIPIQYELLKNKINNSIINKMYSKFSFKYFKFNDLNNEKNICQSFFLNLFITYLKKFKLILYDELSNGIPIMKSNCIFSAENECIIIEQIEKPLLDSIINNLKKQQISIINVNNELNDEINSFCANINFKEIIKSNEFVNYTIKSIVGFIIGRFYYPSNYFKDSSFFNFDQQNEETKIKAKLNEYFFNEKSKLDNINNEINNFKNMNKSDSNIEYEFHEKDFIDLKIIYSNKNALYYLVLHLQTLHIFLMKKYFNLNEKYFKREKNFCNYSHRCLTRFYGFLKKGEKIVAIIYEFMCGKSLDNYIKNNAIDEIFLLTNISRIFQGIDYLHSKELIHRDLKPQNILIDHDGLAYISDFETIRSVNPSQNDEFTNDVGTPLYLSIEQSKGENISYSTDIYSFGLIIFYMYEKKHLLSMNKSNARKIIPMTKGQNNVRFLYEKCSQIKSEDRMKNDEIKSILNSEFNSSYYLEQYLMNGKYKMTNLQIINFIFEKLIIQQSSEFCLTQIQFLRDFYLLNLASKKSSFFFFDIEKQYSHDIVNLGNHYKNGEGIEQNYKKAKEYYEQAVKFHNSDALCNLGILYDNGNGVEKDYLKAKEYYELSAKLGNSDALSNLGFLYEKGNGVEKNYLKAKEYYELSAKLGNSNGINNLGSLYDKGKGVEQDYLKAKKYYEQAACLNNSEALNNLGFLYESGNGVERNYMKAKEYYEQAAKLNDPYAFNNLGFLYMDGLGVEQNYIKAKEYFELSAKLNNPDAFLYIGFLYEKGRGVEQNYIKAKEYYEKSANFNNSNALNNLGDFYFHGYGVKQDYLKAMKYYEKSAEFNDSDALNNLGNFYCHGICVEQNYLKAKEYYERSAELGNSIALNNLGHLYANGKGVERNYSKAIEYYEKSAELEDPSALFYLGNMYKNGTGVEQDYLMAFEYYVKSSEYGNSEALLGLGNLYKDGNGVEQNYLTAKEYYELAAELNNSDALNNLANLYEDGKGVEQNYLMAKHYYELSAKLNNPIALVNLGNLYEDGAGVERNYLKAKECYELAAYYNNPNAFLNLGNIYYFGRGVDKNYLKAKEYYEKSALFNNSEALLNLGHIYILGQGIEPNYVQAIYYFEQSAYFNNSEALFNLGILYAKGEIVKQNYLKAKEYLERSANLNNSDALNDLGDLYYHGLGVEQDYSQALKYFEQSAKLNNPNALLNLGNLYANGIVVEQDISKAIRYYERSASLHNSDALNNLGDIFYFGNGVKQDYKQAIKYFELSSELNNSDAFNNLGNIYENGLGVVQNFKKAIEYYKKSAELNNPSALFNLGYLYLNGNGIERDYLKARKCFEFSAKYNNSNAFLVLGIMYEGGFGVKQNYKQAIKYYEQSAELDNLHAIYHIGDLFSNGDLGFVDLEKSISYLSKSINIQSGLRKKYKLERTSEVHYETNNYRYISYNILGLIYLIDYKNIEKAEENLKESAFAEYPVGQNNFGLFCQFFLNEIGNADYMFKRSSKHKFSLAEFNLGSLLEAQGKIKESIKYFIQASEHEDEKLKYRDLENYDKRLKISKTFIICFTNLKLTEYFFSNENYEKSKLYFNKAFKMLDIEYLNYEFNFILQIKDEAYESYSSDIFSYIKKFILNFPLFNLINQPNLDAKLISNHNCGDDFIIESKENNNLLEINKKSFDDEIKNPEYYDIDNQLNKEVGVSSISKLMGFGNERIFKDPCKLFDFVINSTKINKSSKLKMIFINEINSIINIMKEILYTPPYSILFGRISIIKPIPKEKDKRKDIDINFYEGFEN